MKAEDVAACRAASNDHEGVSEARDALTDALLELSRAHLTAVAEVDVPAVVRLEHGRMAPFFDAFMMIFEGYRVETGRSARETFLLLSEVLRAAQINSVAADAGLPEAP